MAIPKVNNTQTVNIDKSSMPVTSTSDNGGTSVSIVAKKAKTEADVIAQLKLLGIPEDKFNAYIVSKFGNKPLTADEKFELITQYNIEQNNTAEISKLIKTDNTDSTTNTSVVTTEPQEDYNFKKFSTLSKQEKQTALLEELAKNKFLYGDENNKRTIEEWNALSQEARTEFINKYKPVLQERILEISSSKTKRTFNTQSELRNYLSSIATDDDLDNMLNSGATGLQAANYLGISADEFLKLPKAVQETHIHDYLTSLDAELLTEGQRKYLSNCQNYTSAVINYAKKHDAESDYAKFDETGNTFTISELAEYAKSKNTNLDEMQVELLADKAGLSQEEQNIVNILIKSSNTATRDAEIKKLGSSTNTRNVLNKIAQSNLNEDEKIRLKELIIGKVAFEEIPTLNESKVLTDIQNDEVAGSVYNDGNASDEAKIGAAYKYIHENYQNLSPEEFANKVADLLGGLKAKKADGGGESSIAFKLYAKIMQHATPEQKDGLLKKFGSSFYNIANVNELTPEQTAELANPISNGEGATNLLKSSVLLDNANDEHVIYLDSLSGAKDVNIQRGYVDRTHKAKNSEVQRHMTNCTAANSKSEVKGYAASKVDKLDISVQNDALEILIKDDKIATDIANESRVVTRMASQNQTRAMNAIKSSIENLWQGDDAISRLNSLSDQVQDCDKDNQLDMHNLFMSSNYSEVQEHAAGNIHNYDPSAQAGAIEATYATGNQAAITACEAQLNQCSGVNASESTYANYVQNQSTAQNINEALASGDSQKLVQLVLNNSLEITKYLSSCSQKDKEIFVENFCKAATESQLLNFIKNNKGSSSMLELVMKYSNGKVSKGKLFGAFYDGQKGNIAKLLNILDIKGAEVINLAESYKEHAPDIALAVDSSELARMIITNPEAWGYQMGRAETEKLQQLASHKELQAYNNDTTPETAISLRDIANKYYLPEGNLFG